jgi:tetratricopeptide (TPR) repeat protein
MRPLWFLTVLIVAAGCQNDSLPTLPKTIATQAAVPAAAQKTRPGTEVNEGPVPEVLRQEPIPQDSERMKKRRTQRLASVRASGVETYARVGSRNPKWDTVVKDALEKVAIAKVMSDRDGDAVMAAVDALTEAVRLGCDDPYVRYLQLQYSQRIIKLGRITPEAVAEFVAAGRALQASAYPAIRRANAAHNANISLPAPKTLDGVVDSLKSTDWAAEIELAVQALRDDPDGGAETYVDLASLAQTYFIRVPGGRQKAYEAFRDALNDVPNADAVRHWMTGRFLLDRAQGKWAMAIAEVNPEENKRGSANDVEAAADAFEEAWKIDPTHAEIAVGRMHAAGRLGQLDEMEAWFRKAITVDGDCYAAVKGKAEFLRPRSGGHREAVRQFADRLAETRNWHGMLPMEAISMLRGIESFDMTPRMDDRDWATVERICDDFLKERPDSHWGWSLLAHAANDPARPEAILRAAKHLGDKPSPLVFGPGEFEMLHQRAQKNDRR